MASTRHSPVLPPFTHLQHPLFSPSLYPLSHPQSLSLHHHPLSLIHTPSLPPTQPASLFSVTHAHFFFIQSFITCPGSHVFIIYSPYFTCTSFSVFASLFLFILYLHSVLPVSSLTLYSLIYLFLHLQPLLSLLLPPSNTNTKPVPSPLHNLLSCFHFCSFIYTCSSFSPHLHYFSLPLSTPSFLTFVSWFPSLAFHFPSCILFFFLCSWLFPWFTHTFSLVSSVSSGHAIFISHELFSLHLKHLFLFIRIIFPLSFILSYFFIHIISLPYHADTLLSLHSHHLSPIVHTLHSQPLNPSFPPFSFIHTLLFLHSHNPIPSITPSFFFRLAGALFPPHSHWLLVFTPLFPPFTPSIGPNGS